MLVSRDHTLNIQEVPATTPGGKERHETILPADHPMTVGLSRLKQSG